MFELALRSELWHAVEHTCFLATALLFWWPVIQPWPSRARWPRWAMIPYLLLADLQNTALSAFLIFCDRVVYPTYATAPRIFGMSALEDQAAAGAIMWVPGSFAFLIPLAVISIRLMSPSRAAVGLSIFLFSGSLERSLNRRCQRAGSCRKTAERLALSLSRDSRRASTISWFFVGNSTSGIIARSVRALLCHCVQEKAMIATSDVKNPRHSERD